jgi:hypothetical protein
MEHWQSETPQNFPQPTGKLRKLFRRCIRLLADQANIESHVDLATIAFSVSTANRLAEIMNTHNVKGNREMFELMMEVQRLEVMHHITCGVMELRAEHDVILTTIEQNARMYADHARKLLKDNGVDVEC